MFWIKKEKVKMNDEAFRLIKEDKQEFEKWRAQKNNAYFSAVIISNKIDDNNENLKLTITFPKKVIIKEYKLTFNTQWNFKSL